MTNTRVSDQCEITILPERTDVVARLSGVGEKYKFKLDIFSKCFSCKNGNLVSIMWMEDLNNKEELKIRDQYDVVMNGQIFHYDFDRHFACISFGGLVMEIEGKEEDMAFFSKKKKYIMCFLKNESQ